MLLNVIPEENPNHREPKAQGQTSSSTGDTVLSAPFLIFSVFYPCQKILAAAEMKVRRLKMSRPVWTHILIWAPAGSVYGEASHVLFRVGSASALDQSLIERSSDWLLLSICSGMKEDPRLPHGSRSILAYIECKALEKAISLGLSRALVAPLGCLGDISLMRYMMGHAMVQIPCWLKPMSVSGVYPRP